MKSLCIDGHQLLPEKGSSAHPWQLTYRGTLGENPVLTPRFATYRGATRQDHSLLFRWDVQLTDTVCPVEMRVTLEPQSELPEWSIRAELPPGWMVTHLEFPRVTVRRASDTKAILSAGYGVEYAVGPYATLQSRYPSCTGTMQLVLLHNSRGALYYATEDGDASDKLFAVMASGDEVTLSTRVAAAYDWSGNGEFALPWSTVLGFTANGWQEAVERWYRPFTFTTVWGAKTVTERADLVGWMKDADLWLRPMGVAEEITTGLDVALDYFGKDVGIHWYNWQHHPFDTKYPEYFPCKEGFEAMVSHAQRKGARVTPYINGRLWDPNTASYKEMQGEEASCRKPDGTLYTEIYGSKVLNTVTCPSHPTWQNIIKGLGDRLIQEVKTDGLYIDQVGAAPSEPCYAAHHPHAPGGGSWWHYAYRELIQAMRAKYGGAGKALTTEENAECYIDLFDMMLIVNTPHAAHQKMVPLFPLVYSDRAIYSGYSYIPRDMKNGVIDFLTARSLLWGSQLGWVEPDRVMLEEYAEEAAFLKALTLFRKQHRDLFVGGRFLGELTLSGEIPRKHVPGYETTPVVLGAEWQSGAGNPCYLLVNMDSVPHRVTLPNGQEITVGERGVIRHL